MSLLVGTVSRGRKTHDPSCSPSDDPNIKPFTTSKPGHKSCTAIKFIATDMRRRRARKRRRRGRQIRTGRPEEEKEEEEEARNEADISSLSTTADRRPLLPARGPDIRPH